MSIKLQVLMLSVILKQHSISYPFFQDTMSLHPIQLGRGFLIS